MKNLLMMISVTALFFYPAVATINAQVKINEFLADNVATNPDMFDYDDFSDWIELYNEGSAAVDLSGYSLTGNFDNPKKSVIPSGVSIPANSYLLFWADKHNAVPGTELPASRCKDYLCPSSTFICRFCFAMVDVGKSFAAHSGQMP